MYKHIGWHIKVSQTLYYYNNEQTVHGVYFFHICTKQFILLVPKFNNVINEVTE